MGRLHGAVEQVFADCSQNRGLLFLLLLALLALALGRVLGGTQALVIAIVLRVWLVEVVVGAVAHKSARGCSIAA